MVLHSIWETHEGKTLRVTSIEGLVYSVLLVRSKISSSALMGPWRSCRGGPDAGVSVTLGSGLHEDSLPRALAACRCPWALRRAAGRGQYPFILKTKRTRAHSAAAGYPPPGTAARPEPVSLPPQAPLPPLCSTAVNMDSSLPVLQAKDL